MNLLHLFQLLRRYWWIVAISVVVCLGVTLAMTLAAAAPSFVATSSIVASDPAGTTSLSSMSTIAQDEVETLIASEEVADAVTEVPPSQVLTDSNRVDITVSAGTPESAVNAANDLAQQAVDSLNERYSELRESYLEDRLTPKDLAELPSVNESWDFRMIQDVLSSDTLFKYCRFDVIPAVESQEMSGFSLKLPIGGVALGVLAGVTIVVIVDSRKRLILNALDLGQSASAPIIGHCGTRSISGEVWGNLQLVCGAIPRSVAVIPLHGGGAGMCVQELVSRAKGYGVETLGNVDSCQAARKVIDEALGKSDGVILACEPFIEGMSPIFAAKAAEAALICVQYGVDSMKDFDRLVDEFELAQIKPVGIAVCD